MNTEPAERGQSQLAVNAATDRWRPSRAGLVNVWQFGNEELEFESGRLVLYGPNGSGKTMALELLLPYLLDANAQPSRLSTSGADRGGLWDRVTGYEKDVGRTGYLWLEFVRPDGGAFTIGVRLRAKPSSGGEKHWFTTTQRVGRPLQLVDTADHPISVERLKEALGPAGQLWGSDTEGYRAAVRNTLFPGWSADRFEALIAALLVVRKQHVTDGLSPKLLSSLLSEALPPLDDVELNKVADGFGDLDKRRDHIAQLDADVTVTRKLARANRDYARTVVARTTTGVTQAQTRVDNVTRRVKDLSTKHQEAFDRKETLDARAREIGDEDAAFEARLHGLHASEAYKRGGQLAQLRGQVQDADNRAQTAEQEATREEETSERLLVAARLAESDAAAAAGHVRTARIELEESAALLGAEFIELRDDSLASGCEAWIDARHAAVKEVREALDEHMKAVSTRDTLEVQRDRCEDELTQSEVLLDRERAARADELARWDASVTKWKSGASELVDHLIDAAVEDPTAAVQVVAEARRRAAEPLIEARTRLVRAAEDLEHLLEAVRTERAEWSAGKEPEPAPPAGRRDRSGSQGSPFWRLVQFREEVPADVRGTIEAALADARLLDAWVASDGALALPDDVADIVMRPPNRTMPGGTLAAVLERDPAADGVPHGTVDALLQSIPLVAARAHEHDADADLLIARDGTWKAHRLAARAFSGAAQFIGASSRAAARAAKILALDAQIGELEERMAENTARRSKVDSRLAACETELRTFPSPDDVLRATRAYDLGQVRTQHKNAALSDASERVKQASLIAQERLHALSLVAMRHELPAHAGKLDDVTSQLHRIGQQLRIFEGQRERSVQVGKAAVAAAERATDAKERAIRRRDGARSLNREARSQRATLDEVERTVGADYREVLGRIDEITSKRKEIRREMDDNSKEREQLAALLGSLASQLEGAEQDRRTAEVERAQANARFIASVSDGLLRDADVPAPPSAAELGTHTATLEAARRVRGAVQLPAEVDDARLQRLSNNVVQQAADAERQLVGRADLVFETTDHGWSVVRARRDGVRASAYELLAGIGEDLQAARAELTRKQQELFEQILSGSVREHLRDRLWAAQALVDRINAVLGLVRTAAGGVRVTLDWEIDPDLDDAAELRRAKELLLRDSPLADGRGELDHFLQGRIERIRAAENDTGQWRDRLAEMLNYRAWHRFRVMVHHKRFGDRPRPLEGRNVSLSAGEKTIVMVLPLLAAVTSHYQPPPGEPPSIAPRLLLMDELFTKVDYPNKRQLLGLLPQLDLDAVFTSDKDRCEYDTIDAIAIHVFQKLDDDSSTTTRLVWNGSGLRVTDPLDASPSLASAE